MRPPPNELLPGLGDPADSQGGWQELGRGDRLRLADRLGISRRTVNYWENRAIEFGDPVPWSDPAGIPAWYSRVHGGRALPGKVMRVLLGGTGKKEAGEVAIGKNVAPDASASSGHGLGAVDFEGSLERLHSVLVGEMGHLERALGNREDALSVRTNREDLLKLADRIRQVSKGIQSDLQAAGRLVDRSVAKDEFLTRAMELKKRYRSAFRAARGRLLACGDAHEWEETCDRIAEDAEVAFIESLT
jgi:hypothetical protein